MYPNHDFVQCHADDDPDDDPFLACHVDDDPNDDPFLAGHVDDDPNDDPFLAPVQHHSIADYLHPSTVVLFPCNILFSQPCMRLFSWYARAHTYDSSYYASIPVCIHRYLRENQTKETYRHPTGTQ